MPKSIKSKKTTCRKNNELILLRSKCCSRSDSIKKEHNWFDILHRIVVDENVALIIFDYLPIQYNIKILDNTMEINYIIDNSRLFNISYVKKITDDIKDNKKEYNKIVRNKNGSIKKRIPKSALLYISQHDIDMVDYKNKYLQFVNNRIFN